MNKLSILQINSSKTWAGGETHIKDLCQGLSDQGHDIYLTVRSQIADNFNDMDINLIILPLKNSVDFYSIYKLTNIIKRNKIDIIHVHNGKDYWLAVLARYFAGRGKIIASRHILKALGNSFLHKKMFGEIDQFIAVSDSVKNKLIKQNNIDSAKIKVIHNGMDINSFQTQKTSYLYKQLKVNNQTFKIGMVGTLCDRKNQEIILETAALINNPNFKFIIIGDDPSEEKIYLNKLQKIIHKYEIENKIIMTGFRDDIANLMSFFDILVVPSKSEAFGLVVIEGMASKTPIIASNVDGIKEIINNNINGFLIDPDDKNELKEKILYLYENENIYSKFCDEGLETVKNKFSLDVMCSKVENAYFQSLR